MNVEAVLRDTFAATMSEFNDSRAVAMLKSGEVTRAHYGAILREIYHYSKEDPQIQALAAVHLRGDDRELVRMFLKHAVSEVGHDQMALRDLAALGENISGIPDSNPLPATIAFTAYPFYQISYRNPIGYLGYLYFLEFMPTQAGAGYQAALKHAGIPDEAMSFLNEHMTVDVAHNRLMEQYLQRLVRTPDDLHAIVYAMRVTGRLYAQMLWDAMESVSSPTDYGINSVEAGRRLPPLLASESLFIVDGGCGVTAMRASKSAPGTRVAICGHRKHTALPCSANQRQVARI